MSDDLDLRGIDHRHEPDPQFRAALQRRVAAIVAGTDPGPVTKAHDLATIDLESTSARPSPKRNRRRVAAAILAAAAAVVAIALAVIRDNDATPADQPSPTVTVPPTTPPRPLPDGSGGAPVTILPGTYFVDEVAGIPTPRIYATLGVGWGNWSDGWDTNKRDDNRTFEEMTRDDNMTPEEAFDEGLQHDVGVMELSHPVAVYRDACHPGDGNHPGPLDTVDGLVAALSEQQGWAEVTVPSDLSIDGYVGKAFQRTAPTDMSDCDIRSIGPRVPDDVPGFPDFQSWENADGPFVGWAGEYYEPGWIETLWVLDLDGTMVVISTGVWPEPSAGADADFAADVLDSIRIARGLPNRAGEQLEPGTYFVDEVAGVPTPRVYVSIGAGWGSDGQWLGKPGPNGLEDGSGFIHFSRPGKVFSDACHWNDVSDAASVATLDSLVTALSEQEGWAGVTVPTDISIDGYVGKTFQRTVPADMSDCDVMPARSGLQPMFHSWENEGSADRFSDGGSFYGAGVIETVLVLDLDGTLVVINTRPSPEASAEARAEFDDVLNSIRIARGSADADLPS